MTKRRGEAQESELVEMFRALSHPNRFRLFMEILNANEAAFEEGHQCFIHTLMRQLNVGAPTVSHHLKELVRADLVSTQKQGKYVTCQVNEDALAKIASFFARTA
jgi:ArsR family transcriptional regulator, arsenate/arsenite/antimonite-responsive transcriptional repressor